MAKTIFLIAGEPSGDALGAALMREVLARAPETKFIGVGGPLMQAQGLKSLYPMEDLCVMGLFEVLGQLPRLLRLIRAVADAIEAARPDIILTIDLPDFNFAVVKRLRARGVKSRFIHYVAPSVWAWRSGRAKMLAGLYDGLLCLLPFEPDYFTRHGLDARFVGHPLVEREMSHDSAALRKRYNITPEDITLGLFFGSRGAEFKMIAPVLIEAAQVVKAKRPQTKFVVPTLPQHEARVKEILAAGGIEAAVISDQSLKWDAFAACDAALAVSGTVGLELAYLRVPHIAAYRVHPVTAFIAKRLIKIGYIHLANIILGRMVVPEVLQEECTAENLSARALELLENPGKRRAQKDALADVAEMLGAHEAQSPSQKAADYILVN